MKGIPASPGLAIAKALIVKHVDLNVEATLKNPVNEEIQRFNDAIKSSSEDINQVRNKAVEELGEDKAAIFDAHLMILEDPEMVASTISMIESSKVSAEYAFQSITNQFVQIFESMNNEYMKERAADIKDVSKRVISKLLGQESIDLSKLDSDVILIAHDLTPSETATMDKSKVLGFITEIGGKTSHTAIMARTLEIPAVVGFTGATETIKNGDLVMVNGVTGMININPSQEEINSFTTKQDEYIRYRNDLKEFHGKETLTKDGHHVELAGNIGSAEDLDVLLKNDAEGVGLFRTEFLYMNRDQFPSEEEQFTAYKTILEGMKNKPVVIRTLDIGGDKHLDYLKLNEEMNPFLGYRAIRICLDQPEIFRTQLRALFRASVYGNLRIMFPMISSLEELLEARKVVDSVKAELMNEGVSYSESVQIGMMIEIPSAAIISDILAKHVDFFSIGTNDLIQYSCAVDRMNEKISHLYNPYHPALIRMVKMVIDAGHSEGIWVGMCGEVAGDPTMIPLLLGLGLDEFSMSPISILSSRKIMSELSMEKCRNIATQVMSLSDSDSIKRFLLSGKMN